MIHVPVGEISPSYAYQPALSALSAFVRTHVAEDRPLPHFAEPGTGGLLSEAFYRARIAGYRLVELEQQRTPFVELMQVVKTGFGRTMTRLPEVFGVSRQTLYNWL